MYEPQHTPARATIRRLSRWWLALAVLLATFACEGGQAQAAASATYAVSKDTQGQTTIVVAGEGAAVTLADIQQGLGANAGLLERQGTIWQLNANLLIDRNVTLN